MKITYLVIGILIFFLVGGIAFSQLRGGSVAAKPLPNDTLAGVNAKPGNLNDFLGQVVLVNFWASWCGTCREETPDIVQTYNKYHSRGFVAVGINYGEDRDTAAHFLTAYGVNYPSFLDPDKKLAEELGVVSMPTSFLIDRSGKIHPLPLGQLNVTQLDPQIESYLAQ